MAIKQCTKCKSEVDVSLFCKDSHKPDGLSSHCFNCRKLKGINYIKFNKHKIVKYREVYDVENKERISKTRRLYKINNKDSIREKNREYLSKKRLDPEFRLRRNLRSRVSGVLKKKCNVRGSLITEYIGCSIPELKFHLESQFTDGMSWDNYGIGGWELDHIEPICRANNREEFIKLSHYINFRPLWVKDNRKKGST